MKKLLKVSFVAMLVAAPFAANAATAPLTYVNQAGTAYNEANKPATLTASTTVATKSYVDGAYNELAEAVNTVNSNALTLSTAETGTFTKSAGNASSASIGAATTIGGAINNVAAQVDTNTAAIANKANSADVYTKTEADTLLGAKANSADVYTKAQTYSQTEVDTALADKANSADVYTKAQTYSQTEVDTALADKANSADVYTKTEVDNKISGLDGTTADTSLAESNGVLAVQVDTTHITRDGNGNLTLSTADANAIADVANKLDSSAAASTYATKTELANKRVEVVQTWGSATTSKVALVDNN